MNLAEIRRAIERHQQDAPVLVVPLARELGLEVYKTQEWTDAISGMIRRDPERGGEAGYAIYINDKHHENRKRFTIAHETAHFILHRDFIGDGIEDDALYRSGLSSRLEAQANRFAADILMPWHLINNVMDKGIKSIEDLAANFKVSKSAMSIRLGVPYEN